MTGRRVCGMFCQDQLLSCLLSSLTGLWPTCQQNCKMSLGSLTCGWKTMNFWFRNTRFSGENKNWKIPDAILRYQVLLFLIPRDTVPFENQFLEVSFFNILYVFKPRYTVSYILSTFQARWGFLLTVLKSGMLKWNLKCFKIKCFTVRKDIMRSLGKLPKMFLFLLVC